jgi:hypothetical protein
MTDRETRSSTAFKWFMGVAGMIAFYVELVFFEARPVVVAAALAMMGYPGAEWLDRLRQLKKGEGG